MNELIAAETIQQRILIVRGKRVLRDADLAKFYGVTTFNLNKAVTRNPDRFPDDFAFRLTLEESRALIFQSGISKPGRGGTRKPATVFTEQGVAMLASVLRSPRAATVSVAIIRLRSVATDARERFRIRPTSADFWTFPERGTGVPPVGLSLLVNGRRFAHRSAQFRRRKTSRCILSPPPRA